MFTAKVMNSGGETLVLTGQEAVYQLINIDGLNPPPAQINTTEIVGMDGAMFNSAKLNTRNIVLTVVINGEVEKNRLQLYKYFRTKDRCTFYFTNDTLDVSIDGYVDTLECNMFADKVVAQISIICLAPYFRGHYETVEDSGGIEALFTFPFAIDEDEPIPISNIVDVEGIVVENHGESETGCEIVINVLEDFDAIKIVDTQTGDAFEVDYSFATGDTLVINTIKGQKTVYNIRGGEITNIFAYMVMGSTFFQLRPGANTFTILIDGAENPSAAKAFFGYYNQYRGV